MSAPAGKRHRRGTLSNPPGRFAGQWAEAEPGEDSPGPRTRVQTESIRSIISRNDSPDLPFSQSINPYRGCEHGCIYCYARPSHAYMDLSPGTDFETRLFSKPDAPSVLLRSLARPGYRCQVIALGTNTDPYQPIERDLQITRRLLEVFRHCNHPVSIVTKSALVLRDTDLLASLAAERLASVMISITTLDSAIKRRMEPAAASAGARLQAIAGLARAGVPVGVFVAPLIPGLTDHELESILRRAAEAGASHAMYSWLRLPFEVAALFRDWLQAHYPLRARHVMSLVGQLRGGRDNDPRFGFRMHGTGPLAELADKRFRSACRKHGLSTAGAGELDCSRFTPPVQATAQLRLFEG